MPEEPLALEKLFPLLGLVRVPDAARGIDAARALLRIGGAGHSAVIHSRDPRTILAYGAAVRVLRVTVNAPGSTGSCGLDTNLAPTMTVGTGFFGRSSLTENLAAAAPHAVDAAGLRTDPAEPFGDFGGLQPWSARPGARAGRVARAERDAATSLSRDELRRLILDELRELVRARWPSCAPRSSSTSCSRRPCATSARWIRGRLPRTGMAAAVIEVAPGLDIEPLTDVAVKHTQLQAGILVVERQFGYLEFHSRSTAAVRSASAAVLEALGASRVRRDAAEDPRLDARLAPRPPARVPDQPQQARLDGAAGRVAVRARDAARLVRDPRGQRGREGGATSRSSTTA